MRLATPSARAQAAIDAIRHGHMVIMVDDEDRENEGDLVLAADKVTPEAINFMATHARGLICLAMDGGYIDRLELPMMVRDNQASLGTAFTVSIEARHGVSTGISARDRATTIAAAIADDARPTDLVSPGHVFPLRARKGGVLVRTGQTEGSVDIARLAGCKPAGVICEIMRADGEMARMPELEAFAAQHGLVICSVADLIAYRLEREHIVRRRREHNLRPGYLGPGEPWRAFIYDTDVEDTEYLALVRGQPETATGPVLCRVAALDPVVDTLALRPDVESALRLIDDAGCGVFLYVYNRGRQSLERSLDKVTTTAPRTGGPRIETSSEALRDFGLGAQVLADLGLSQIRLLSNSDRKIVGIEGFGIEVVERVALTTRSVRAKADVR
jgi:3,4-dihydroxy 2-butanone 4-phosphate synthase / GTP cyclohydrolase II